MIAPRGKHLLIVFHSQTGKNRAMAAAVYRGATDDAVEAVEVRLREALDAGVEDILWCDAVILGTPENFGYMSGAMKVFLDRIFYPCAGRLEGLPYAVFIGTGNDGSGAVSSIQRIVRGFPWQEVQPPVIVNGALSDADLELCEQLGMTIAAGLELGMY